MELSTLSFGSMRLPADRDDQAVLDLLLRLVDGGVTSFHSSTEYDTFPRFAALLGRLRSLRPAMCFQHIVKLAAPHFGHDRFDRRDLVDRLDAYRSALQADRIDIVQWMVRFDLKQEARRLEILRESAAEIGDTVATLRAWGRIGAFACFPYTDAFAAHVVDAPWCDGLADYLNVIELDRGQLLPELRARGRGFIALRPLAAGRALSPDSGHHASRVAEALAFPLLDPQVASIVLSVSSAEHVDAALLAVAAARPDPHAFDDALRRHGAAAHR